MRLIDADALAEALGIAEDCQDCQYKNGAFCKNSSDFVNACEAIYDAPTIGAEWIPVSERLPEENVPVLLGIRFKDDFKMFVTSRQDYNYWTGLGREIKGEMRWMPLPTEYKAGEQE